MIRALPALFLPAIFCCLAIGVSAQAPTMKTTVSPKPRDTTNKLASPNTPNPPGPTTIIDSNKKNSQATKTNATPEKRKQSGFPKETVQLEFDETGRLLSAPPAMATGQTPIRVLVHTTQADYENRVIDVFNTYLTTINNLTKYDANKKQPAFLDKLGIDPKLVDDTNANSRRIVALLASKYAGELRDLAKDPKYSKIIKSRVSDLDGQLAKAQKLLVDTVSNKLVNPYIPLLPLIKIPGYKDLLSADFNLHLQITNVNGFLIDTKNCDKTLPLKTVEDKCCTLSFETSYENIYQFNKGPVRYDFELRRSNPTYKNVTNLIKIDSLIVQKGAGLDLSDIKNKSDSLLNFKLPGSIISENIRQALVNWINSKVKQKEDQKILGMLNDSLGKKQDVLKILASKQVEAVDMLKPLTTVYSRALFLQYAWATQAAYFTSNPLVAPPTVSGSSLDTLKKQLKQVQTDSINNSQVIISIDKATTAGGDVNVSDLRKNYEELVAKRSAFQTQSESLKDKIKQNTPKASGLPYGKNGLVSDSLLYSGQLFINQTGSNCSLIEWLFFPNRTYYAFMRHHDALEDFHLMGRNPKKDINETQRMYVMVENAKKDAKYVLKTTVTPIKLSDDVEGFGSELAKLGGGSNGVANNANAVKPVSLDSIYKLNQTAQKKTAAILGPLKDGVLTSAPKENKDLSPNYMTKTLDHQEPYLPPSLVNYAILDSATSKNLNSEQASFNYRYNKLYRFRLKAGIAYSSLVRRNYTINTTTNTATYADSYTNLGPTFGMQIFISKIDIQSQRLFPTGIYPYLYVGYLFNDAPANNFLVGGGWEVYSGFAIGGGLHLGKSQRLSVTGGTLQEKDYFKTGWYLSASIGLEAFSALFNTAKVSPFKAP